MEFKHFKIEDAYRRMQTAWEQLELLRYSAAIREAQASIESAVKSLLDPMGISYMEEKKTHDVSGYIPKLYESLKARLKDYNSDLLRLEMAKTAIISKALTSIRPYVEFGVEDLNVPTDYAFQTVPEFVKVCVKMAEETYFMVERLLHHLKPLKT